jgi:putative membrane protein
MKYLTWLLNAAIFFALFAFALNNQAPVTLHLFFGVAWQAPLVLALFAALLVGVALGVLVMLPLWLRARRARAAAPRPADAAADKAPPPAPEPTPGIAPAPLSSDATTVITDAVDTRHHGT